MDVQYI